nr:hypothetical protein CFP56_77267 [Quercus suber]
MFRLTLAQVGLRPIEEHVNLSSAHITSSDHVHSPTYQHSLSEHFESLTPQSTTFLTSLFSFYSVPNQKHQPPHLITSNIALPPSNLLKRKVTKKELELFAKRLRIAARGPKLVFFDPETVALIPQSSLEYFILKERQKTEDEVHNCKSFYHNLSEICSHTNANTNSAEEAGLIMPPLSP